MTDEHLELLVIGRQLDVAEAEAVDGGAMNARQIGVVGFVAGIGGLTELLRGERMDEPDLETRLGWVGGIRRCVRWRR